jgi:hypothetical protein
MAKTKRAEDFSQRDFTMMELRIPSNVHNLLSELATYRGENLENMALNMLLYELDGELHNEDDMGDMIAKYLRQKHNFKEGEA